MDHPGHTSNKYCSSTDLSNEASVEAFFILPMLRDLGYKNNEIKTKQSIGTLKIPKGRQKENYKPDYIIMYRRKRRWLLDAKATDERIEDYTYQCAGYSLLINRKFADNPLHYYILSNGLLTRVYVWDQEEPILSLRFSDFVEGNSRFETLHKLLGAEVIRKKPPTEAKVKTGIVLARPSTMDEVKRAFLRCHKIIWKAEKMSPQAAFVEFAKLLFVKLWEDRRLRDDSELFSLIGKDQPIPIQNVRFSVNWINEQEVNEPNPINAILFRQLVELLEQSIAQRKRKRIFDANERLALSPGTIRRVVEQLQGYYLFGIDEDLNGRMFEAFLAAVMRGQALGQYFTPRSIVKMMTRLGNLRAQPGEGGIERVIDACCGTGGFLIEALTEMRRQIWDNKSLTVPERDQLLEEISNQAIFGIDAGRAPAIAQIARINMYLHGDGGSRVYMTDSLRDPPTPSAADATEVREEVRELREVLESGLKFDVVLTNPPFSMDYSYSVPEERQVLDAFTLLDYLGTRRGSLRSSVMFLERYWHLLRQGGRLLTVIDDSVLSTRNYDFVRKFIREKFIIKAIISLHGDAFQRAGARCKTSVLYLVKRSELEESQPAAFVYESRYIGLDDVVPKTPTSVASEKRKQAVTEIDDIVSQFQSFLRGQPGAWLVSSDKLKGRLDAKYLRPWTASSLEVVWQAAGASSSALGDLVELVRTPVDIEQDHYYNFIQVTYSGQCRQGETRLGKEITYADLSTAQAGDIIVSGLGAVYGAVDVLPEGMENLLISSEFLILRPKPESNIDPMYLRYVLRSPAMRAEWLSTAHGLARHRLDWKILGNQRIPVLDKELQRKIGKLHKAALKQEKNAEKLRSRAVDCLNELDLSCEAACEKLERAKPPR